MKYDPRCILWKSLSHAIFTYEHKLLILIIFCYFRFYFRHTHTHGRHELWEWEWRIIIEFIYAQHLFGSFFPVCVCVQYQQGNLLNPSQSITSSNLDVVNVDLMPMKFPWFSFWHFQKCSNSNFGEIHLFALYLFGAVAVVVDAVRWNLLVLEVNLTWIVVLPLDMMAKSSAKWPHCII